MSVVLVSPAGTKQIDTHNCFMWSLIFGPFYFASVGVWDTAVISFILAVVSGGISVLVYPFFTEKIVISSYTKRGWKIKPRNDLQGMSVEGMSLGNCESCGMPIDIHSCSKLDCRYCVYCQDQKTGHLKPYGQVREESIAALMERKGMSKAEAEKMTEELMAKLNRWKVK
jgi:Putative zinc ribbon domain